jgi:uncharacterized protein (TIGR02246 family)
MKLRTLLAALFGVLLLLLPLHAEDKEPPKEKEDPAHEELRAFRKQLVEAVNKGDIDALLELLDENVVVHWLDGRVSSGPKEVKAYIEEMLKGPNRKVERYETNPEVTELTHLYGDGKIGVVYGSSTEKFVLTGGHEMVVPTRWSATLVKKDGKWKIANFHGSTSMFDNPILSAAVQRTGMWVGIIAGLGGLFLGFILARLIPRRAAT